MRAEGIFRDFACLISLPGATSSIMRFISHGDFTAMASLSLNLMLAFPPAMVDNITFRAICNFHRELYWTPVECAASLGRGTLRDDD